MKSTGSSADLARPARRLANNPHIYQWLNGLAVVPTWHALYELDILSSLQADQGEERLVFGEILKRGRARHPTMPAGGLLGACRTLAFQGWLSIEDRGLDSRLGLTQEGREALSLLDGAASTIAVAIAALPWLSRLSDIAVCTGAPGLVDRAAALRGLAELSSAGWTIGSASGGERNAIAVQAMRYVDALVLCPVLVALARPGLLGEASVFEMVRKRTAEAWRSLPQAEPLLAAMLDFLQDQGIGAREGDGWCLTEAGASLAAEAANFGVITSYLETFARFTDYLGGASDVFDVENDGHVDRALNIWGSSGATTAKAIRQTVCDRVLRTVFDDLPLDEQPLGVADMGCGDGRALAEFADFIVQKTRRGAHLDTHPLHLVGADISPISREAARRNLTPFETDRGVVTAVIEGDVSDPSSFDRAIRSLGWADARATASSFLHTQMFLLHDRQRSIEGPDRAIAELDAAIERTSDFAIEDALLSTGRSVPPPPWSEAEHREIASGIAHAFTTSCCDRGDVVPAVVVGADLIALLRRWHPHAPFGILIVEPHVPRLEEIDGSGRDRNQVDPAPAVWGVHFPSNQYLMPFPEFELGLTLAGYSTVERWNSATGGLSMTWSVSSDLVYRAMSAPSGPALEPVP